MSDWNNDYSYAGPGYKRRMQQERNARKRETSEPKPTPIKRERLPAHWKRRKEKTEFKDVSGSELRKAIHRLTRRGKNVPEIEALLKEDDIQASKVLISAVRRAYLESQKTKARSTNPPPAKQ
jgi:hypothetical protein